MAIYDAPLTPFRPQVPAANHTISQSTAGGREGPHNIAAEARVRKEGPPFGVVSLPALVTGALYCSASR